MQFLREILDEHLQPYPGAAILTDVIILLSIVAVIFLWRM